MFSPYSRSQHMTASTHTWVRMFANSNSLHSESATATPLQTVMVHINKDFYVYVYGNQMTYQNTVEATLTSRDNVQFKSSFTDDSFFETTEQIQAAIGVEGFGKLQAIVQSKRKALSDTELNELARNFADWDS